MTDTLIHAYAPLLIWPSLGFVLLFVVPESFPRFLGRSLYWVGIPLEIFALTRQTPLSQDVGLSPLFTIGALLGGIPIAWLILQGLRRDTQSVHSTDDEGSGDPCNDEYAHSQNSVAEALRIAEGDGVNDVADQAIPDFLNEGTQSRWSYSACRGSFILSSVIGNTGFVGLAIAPLFVSDDYLGWIVFYSVTHNVVGSYGIGVFLASYYGRAQNATGRWTQLLDVLTVPSLWAFLAGTLTRSWVFPPVLENAVYGSVAIVIPMALLLMGMRLSQLQGWKSLKFGLVPAALKSMVVPLIVGAIAVLVGLSPEPRLALVIMAGMPTAFAGLILAEEYELDRELITGSIVLSTGLLFVTIPLWLMLFGAHAQLILNPV